MGGDAVHGRVSPGDWGLNRLRWLYLGQAPGRIAGGLGRRLVPQARRQGVVSRAGQTARVIEGELNLRSAAGTGNRWWRSFRTAPTSMCSTAPKSAGGIEWVRVSSSRYGTGWCADQIPDQGLVPGCAEWRLRRKMPADVWSDRIGLHRAMPRCWSFVLITTWISGTLEGFNGMKIVLRQDVPKVGEAGTIQTVCQWVCPQLPDSRRDWPLSRPTARSRPPITISRSRIARSPARKSRSARSGRQDQRQGPDLHRQRRRAGPALRFHYRHRRRDRSVRSWLRKRSIAAGSCSTIRSAPSASTPSPCTSLAGCGRRSLS